MDHLAVRRVAAAVALGIGASLCAGGAEAAGVFKAGDILYHSATGGPGGTPITVHHPQTTWPAQAIGSSPATGAKILGSQKVTLPGASLSVALERQSAVKVLAKGAAVVALRSIPPAVVLGFALEGVRYLAGEWVKDEPMVGTTEDVMCLAMPAFWNDYGCTINNRQDFCVAVGTGGYGLGYIASGGVVRQYTFHMGVNNPGGWSNHGSCSSLPKVGGKTVIQWAMPNVMPGSPEPQPATQGDIEDAIEEYLKQNPGDIPAVVREIVDSGQDLDALGFSPPSASGPASVPGPVTTSTRQSDAGTTTNEVEVTYHITYEGNEVGITKTTTTTITYPDSSTETISETVDFPQTGGGEPVEPPTDFCEEHPNASACEPLGDNDGEDPELPEDERSVVFDKKMSATGSCPSPITFTIHGQSYSLEYTPLCTLASGVRPVVLGLGWLSAGIFLFGTLRNS